MIYRNLIWFFALIAFSAFLAYLSQVNSQFVGINVRASILFFLLILLLSLDKSFLKNAFFKWFFILMTFYVFLYSFVLDGLTVLMGYSFVNFEFNVQWETLIDLFGSTNLRETQEYVSDHFFNLASVVLMWFVTSLIAIVGGMFFIKHSPFLEKTKIMYVSLLLWILLYFFHGLAKETHIVPNLIAGNFYYEQAKEQRQAYRKKNKKDYSFSHAEELEDKTVIVVIGESTTRLNMGVYGYDRNTTPFLSKNKTELVVFEHAISTAFYTIPSLTHALTYSYQNNKQWYLYPNIIEVAKKYGYKTYWLSNQAMLGKHDTPVGFIGYQADKVVGINLSGLSGGRFDGDLLPMIKEAINEPVSKKLIIVHTMGTHGTYRKRYPKRFQQYLELDNVTKSLKNRGVTDEIISSRIDYDSAISYVDFFLDSILGLVAEKKSGNSEDFYLLYFSDHGQDVGHFSKTSFGHSHSEAGYKIPLILWPKDNIEKRFKAVSENKKRLVGSDAINLIIGSLLGIESKNDYKNNPLRLEYDRDEIKLQNNKIISLKNTKDK